MSGVANIRSQVAAVLEAENSDDFTTRLVNFFLLALIATNGVALVLGTVADIHSIAPRAFELFERISIYVFTVEYALRLWSYTTLKRFRGPMRGRLKFIFSPMGIVDVLATVPFYLPILGVDLRSIRMLRLLRVFRLVKLGRYSKTLQLFGRVGVAKKEELGTVLVFVGLLLVMTSTVLYYAESNAQPELFSSIPTTMWWAVETLTTVGYGDMVPSTELGRLMGAVVAIIGVGVFALPAGILASGFIQEVQKDVGATKCSHCGESLR